jgi:hypothetical protein
MVTSVKRAGARVQLGSGRQRPSQVAGPLPLRARRCVTLAAWVAVAGCGAWGLAGCSKGQPSSGGAGSASAIGPLADLPPSSAAPSSSLSGSRLQSDDDCRKARACVEFGACTYKEGRCAATSDEDCARSEWCKRVGDCAAHEGICMVSAKTDADCHGKHGEAGRDLCATEGRCTAREGACDAVHDEDCQKSVVCRERGACTVKYGRCALTNEADCRRSAACTTAGLCKYRETRGVARCVSDKEPEEGEGHSH